MDIGIYTTVWRQKQTVVQASSLYIDFGNPKRDGLLIESILVALFACKQ
jgi:hypothetical protein